MISESKLIKMYNVHSTWAAVIQDLLSLPQVEALKAVLGKDADCTVPSKYNIFNAFSIGVEDVRCVIVGQDVYPNDNALGYSFAIPKDVSLTPSLQIISEELVRTGYSDLKEGENKELKYWTSQGVLLLNRALTTRRGKSNAHAEEWKFFTDGIMEHLTAQTDIVYMLWGANAREVKPLIRVDHSLILEACHPIAQRYSGGKKMFVGCDHFKSANSYLGKREINW